MFIEMGGVSPETLADVWALMGPCLVVHDELPEYQTVSEEEWSEQWQDEWQNQWHGEGEGEVNSEVDSEADAKTLFRVRRNAVQGPAVTPAGPPIRYATLSYVDDPVTLAYVLNRLYGNCHLFPRETDPAEALDFCHRVIEPAISELARDNNASNFQQALCRVEAAGLSRFPWFTAARLTDPWDGSCTLFLRTRLPGKTAKAKPAQQAKRGGSRRGRPVAVPSENGFVSRSQELSPAPLLLPQLWQAGHRQWRCLIQCPPWLPAEDPDTWLAAWVAHYAPRFREGVRRLSIWYPQEPLRSPLPDTWLPRLIREYPGRPGEPAPPGDGATVLVRADDPASVEFLLTVLPFTDHGPSRGVSALFALSGRLRPDARTTRDFCQTRLRPTLYRPPSPAMLDPNHPEPLGGRGPDGLTHAITQRWPWAMVCWGLGRGRLFARLV